MNYNHRFMIFATLITTCFTAGAQGVYENVDKQGTVEFSDQPTPGAKEIEVDPNVVDVTPAEPIDASPPASRAGATKAPDGSTQPETNRHGVAGDYIGDYEDRRGMPREHEERKEHRESGKAAVHKGAHRR